MGVLESHVLVLNRFFAAVHVVTVRRAFCLLCKGAAEVVSVRGDRFDTYSFEGWCDLSRRADRFPGEEGEVVRTVSLEVRAPHVVRLLLYDRMPRHHIRFNRHNIFARDGHRCQYCGRRFPSSELSLDHVMPRRLGGPSTWTNLVSACTACNTRKGGRRPEEAGMRLLQRPRKPSSGPGFLLPYVNGRHRSWGPFLPEAFRRAAAD